MMELQEIEELFKNVNRGAIKAFLRNAAILKDPAATQEMKALAAENVKAISQNRPIPKPKAAPKQRKQKAAAAEQAIQLAQQPAPQTPAAAAPPSAGQVQPSPKMEFHEEFAQHHGIDPAKFKATWTAMSPEQQKITQDWHAEQLSAPKMKVAKSIDTLYNLFAELKKHL
jgi:hypothetical protein